MSDDLQIRPKNMLEVIDIISRKDSQHPASDVAASIEFGGIHEVSGHYRGGIREGSGSGGDGRFSRFRFAELDSKHASRDGSRLRNS